MDYLDPNKELKHHIILLMGYVLIAIAIVIASIILLYQAYGFGLGKNGTVIQNGLTFFSSQPHPAKIYVNNTLNNSTTNTRLVLPAGIYQVKLARDGYWDWQRTIELAGGSVEHYDYPFLFPKVITTTRVQTYKAAPGLVTQSPDQRWLVISQPDSITNFDVYDLKNPTKVPLMMSLPVGLLSKASNSENLQLEEWSDDNQHVILQHNFDDKTEYILLDRTNPEQSINLNITLAINPSKLTLVNKKYDRYYIYEAATATLQAISLKSPVKTALLQNVLAYKSYGDDSFLYVTDSNAPAGKVLVKMTRGSTTSNIRSLSSSPNYLLDLTRYSGTMYVAVGATNGNKVYIYKDPLGQLAKQPDQAVTPVQVLHVEQPNYLSFSDSAQFIIAENGIRFGVYDIENKTGYNYSAQSPPDTPQLHATWMDGNRLNFVNNGKLNIFDYDATNHQTFINASSNYLPAYTPDYKHVYVITANAANGQFDLTETSLLAPADR